MLQQIVFQDNLYQLSRSIDIVHEGLLLDLASDYFFDKTVDDFLFFDASIQKMYRRLQSNVQVTGYITILHSLVSCQTRYLKLIDLVLQGKATMKDEFSSLIPKLNGIRNQHIVLQTEMTRSIQKSDKFNDSHDIVSQNELSELLNF